MSESTTTKLCRKCQSPMTGAKCRPCANAAAAIYRANNGEKMALANKLWRETYPDRYKASIAKYRANNPEKVAATSKAVRTKNRDKILPQKRAWHAKNAERVNEGRRAKYAQAPEKFIIAGMLWRKANPEKRRATEVAWAAANRDKRNAATKRWWMRNKDLYLVYGQNRRARVRGSKGQLSTDLRERLFALQRGRCACCKQPLGAKYHLDHVIPLALGGANEDWNMQLLRAVCNLQKSAKHPVTYMQEKGYLL